MIDNPNYKGVWKPRQIENPEFFVDDEPCVLPRINALGIDIWTMQGGIHYDNFVIHTDSSQVSKFTAETFEIRKIIEDKQNPSSPGGGMFGSIMDTLTNNPIPVAVTLAVVVIGFIFLCCRGGGEDVPPPKPANGASNGEKKEEQDSDEATEKKEEDKKEEKKEEVQEEDQGEKSDD